MKLRFHYPPREGARRGRVLDLWRTLAVRTPHTLNMAQRRVQTLLPGLLAVAPLKHLEDRKPAGRQRGCNIAVVRGCIRSQKGSSRLH